MQLPSLMVHHVHTNNGTVYCVCKDQVFLRCLNAECIKYMRTNAYKDNLFTLAIDQALVADCSEVTSAFFAQAQFLTPVDCKRLKQAIRNAREGGDYHPSNGFGVVTNERVCGCGAGAQVWLRLTERLANRLETCNNAAK